MHSLTLIHLYPDLMNLYGDYGNILALRRRCEWRGIELNVVPISLADSFDADFADIVFIGGGQDNEQSVLQEDAVARKGPAILRAVESNAVFLAICGGYQLLGKYYISGKNEKIECVGAIDAYTLAGGDRLIGNMVFKCPLLPKNEQLVIGFENHSGRTYRASGVSALGDVMLGHGNNGQDQTEGAQYKNVFCSYSHGSLLPKNPALTDLLLERALKRKYPAFENLAELPDVLEKSTRANLLKTFQFVNKAT